ncbi:MAG: peptidase domain-containing ABC transporter [Labilithrix sp.]|nr:peptidase domain-containing ABC transporter [Labilithrix sp.]
MDCGPTCLRMVLLTFGARVGITRVRELCDLGKQGVSIRSLSRAAEALGIRTVAAQLPLERCRYVKTPFIAHWQQSHFVVVDKFGKDHVLVRDPAHGVVRYSTGEFEEAWAVTQTSDRGRLGTALFLEPTKRMDEILANEPTGEVGLDRLGRYAASHAAELRNIALALAYSIASGIALPFLTQAVVDLGIGYQDLRVVTVLLLAQVALLTSRTVVELLRSRLLLYVGARMSIAIVSDYLFKLMRLPISFFDVRSLGDVLQRIGDNGRIERFLTTSLLGALFSVLHIGVAAVALLVLNGQLALVFLVVTAVVGVWIALFSAKRRELDFKRFNQSADAQGKLIQLVSGLPELKLADAERSKRWEWEAVQARLFRLSVAGLTLEQWQDAGATLLIEGKDVIATLLVAREVIEGRMTLGQMLATQFLLGQTTGPLRQIVAFNKAFQDARISLERLEEVHSTVDEAADPSATSPLPDEAHDIVLHDLTFRYPGMREGEAVLHQLNLCIPASRVTAIVGASGSGKTTLLRLLLRFYEPSEGTISYGGTELSRAPIDEWRSKMGAVLQDGFMFNDTIAHNVALGHERVDRERLVRALDSAAAREFVEALPLGWNTKIGADGQSLSAGQKQRLLIARALYKESPILLFDEATSALDAKNERMIHDALQKVFVGRTVVVIAHRLSTVQSADQIVVLDQGRVSEMGTHAALVARKGRYYDLVKNQLELGS